MTAREFIKDYDKSMERVNSNDTSKDEKLTLLDSVQMSIETLLASPDTTKSLTAVLLMRYKRLAHVAHALRS